ncbi:DUF4397 domain-containing protein [Ferrimonas sp. YFM]|uniref:DUF4397 domain-containing protein n=1 Tax=Ferrimonas sp. YFM TaxID=3028878 RepID=UPI0025734895|nr:DUF4397 domain-containing protein [Ferrimonas sp. YFM]BDY06287.1 hypothetical protein F0521_33280 [Ferrimonas sp. YFM]
MNINKTLFPLALIPFLGLGLAGCDSDDSDSSSNAGHIQLYNGSANAPSLTLTLTQGDDEYSHTGIAYPESSGYFSYDTGNYDLALSWEDSDEETVTLYEDSIKVSNEKWELFTVSGDITQGKVNHFQINEVDLDSDDDQFGVRFINLSESVPAMNIYWADEDEGFDQAELLFQVDANTQSEELYFDRDGYQIFVTATDSDELLYQSSTVQFYSTTQYILILRDDSGSAPLSMDRVSTSTGAVEYPDSQTQAQLWLYNGLIQHELLPEYTGSIDVTINQPEQEISVNALAQGLFSEAQILEPGDYTLDFTDTTSGEPLASNHLVSLTEDQDQTLVVYLQEYDYDEDDEQEDEVKLHTLSLTNSQRSSIYDHQFKVVNLVDDYGVVTFHFLLPGETIADSSYSTTASFSESSSLILPNDSYRIQAVTQSYGTDLLLSTLEVTLNEESGEYYLLLEQSDDSDSEFSLTMRLQNPGS